MEFKQVSTPEKTVAEQEIIRVSTLATKGGVVDMELFLKFWPHGAKLNWQVNGDYRITIPASNMPPMPRDSHLTVAAIGAELPSSQTKGPKRSPRSCMAFTRVGDSYQATVAGHHFGKLLTVTATGSGDPPIETIVDVRRSLADSIRSHTLR